MHRLEQSRPLASNSLVAVALSDMALEHRGISHGRIWCEISLAALRHNFRATQALAGPRRRVIASIKADGYGLGSLPIARVCAEMGAFALWTGNPDQAIESKQQLPSARVLLFAGYLPQDIPELAQNGLIPTIYDMEGARYAASAKCPVYVKVDCGLRRLGLPILTAGDDIRTMLAAHRLTIEGVYSHLPFRDQQTRDIAIERYALFERLIRSLADDGIRPPIVQIWGSSGVSEALPDCSNAVCVGHLLYGLAPGDPQVPSLSQFLPVVSSVRSVLIHVSQQSVDRSHGPASIRFGIIPAGMSEGLPGRILEGKAYALIRQRRAPIIARSLEYVTLDLRDIPDATVGDVVTLIGSDGAEQIRLDDVAEWFGCSALEVLTSFVARVHKEYVEDEAPSGS